MGGRKCDFCELGYYGYTPNGCKKCNCPNGAPCDVNTGKCDCGVNGEKCSLCPPGYIIENGKCKECSDCVLSTLKKVKKLDTKLDKGRKGDAKDLDVKIPQDKLNDVRKVLAEQQAK